MGGKSDSAWYKDAVDWAGRRADYKAWVGPKGKYDISAAQQFTMLTELGLRSSHLVLDVGCGSLRLGRLLIPYLWPGNYFGIEPESWLIDCAFEHELGCDIVAVKNPRFSDESGFDLTVFDRWFDYIIAQSVFSHATAVQIETCLKSAREVMIGSSVFVFNYKLGRRDYKGDEWVYPGTTYYTPALIRHLVEEAGLVYEVVEVRGAPRNQIWVAARATYPINCKMRGREGRGGETDSSDTWCGMEDGGD